MTAGTVVLGEPLPVYVAADFLVMVILSFLADPPEEKEAIEGGEAVVTPTTSVGLRPC